MQFGTSKAKIKHGRFSRRLHSFFQGGRNASAAQPMDVHDVQPQNESQVVDEHDRSTKLEDLNLEDWPLEDSFKPVSNFLDSMPSNSQDTEPERNKGLPVLVQYRRRKDLSMKQYSDLSETGPTIKGPGAADG